eukprot:TRINITY_DN5770_c0_g1_i1.p1 TRINITY_DN5770_c0_g1~~TRINITY_DN5770_c0_g1_i1.p1  ORF type:complete len:270 (+),score=76.81 TRINITY_DN5770_c0_g1_i1:55-864(+)
MALKGCRVLHGLLRRTDIRLPPKKKTTAKIDMRTADEDKLFQLLETYGDGDNSASRKRSADDIRRLHRMSRAYDELIADTDASRAGADAASDRMQRRAVRCLPEVLRAAACRPCTTTWPSGLRRQSQTPPVTSYQPPHTETLVDPYEPSADTVSTLHTGLEEGKDALRPQGVIRSDGSPVSLADEEGAEEDRMRNLRSAYQWWREQHQLGPRAETVHRDFMQMKHEQEVLLYTIRRAKHGLNDYRRKRAMVVAPVLRDDTAKGVMYAKR